MYIIDYIPEGELDGNGHYKLQDNWLKKTLKNQSHKSITLRFRNVVKTVCRIRRNRTPIFMPNLSLYDRFSILDTIVLLLTPNERKLVILHTVSKLDFLNIFFFRMLRNCQVFAYSDTLVEYIKRCGLNHTCSASLAEYPNATLIYELSSANGEVADGTYVGGGKIAIAWGNAARKIDTEKLALLLGASVFDKVLIVGADNADLKRLVENHPTTVELRESATDSELANLLSVASVNLMLFEDAYDFYRSKLAASGVYLTALKFGVPSLISGDFGGLKDEILADGCSEFASSEIDYKRLEKRLALCELNDGRFSREVINLDYLS